MKNNYWNLKKTRTKRTYEIPHEALGEDTPSRACRSDGWLRFSCKEVGRRRAEFAR
jgi:hypothetical protein